MTTTINRSTKFNHQLQPPPVRVPQEAARSPLDRVGVLDEALLKVADEHLQLDGIDALLVLPDLSEGDCARTESGPVFAPCESTMAVDLWTAFAPMDFERSCHRLTSGQRLPRSRTEQSEVIWR
jgi:hypothetical protein